MVASFCTMAVNLTQLRARYVLCNYGNIYQDAQRIRTDLKNKRIELPRNVWRLVLACIEADVSN